MNTLKEQLQLFDKPEKKRFHFLEVSDAISQLSSDVTSSFEAQAEYLVMAFQDKTGEKHWGLTLAL